jgi:hypothetical protein
MSSGSTPVNSSGDFLLDGIHSFDPNSLRFQHKDKLREYHVLAMTQPVKNRGWVSAKLGSSAQPPQPHEIETPHFFLNSS